MLNNKECIRCHDRSELAVVAGCTTQMHISTFATCVRCYQELQQYKVNGLLACGACDIEYWGSPMPHTIHDPKTFHGFITDMLTCEIERTING
jgi:hypothetical protein